MKDLVKIIYLIAILNCGLIYFSSAQTPILTGSQRVSEYLPLLNNKRVAMVVNQTSVVYKMHLVDSLKLAKVNIVKIFAPEHGFRGDVEAGGKVDSYIDKKSKLKVVSLYGNHTKPTAEDLADVDVVIFDIQDVGCRFYTFLSTLQLTMEACAENNKKLILLDRPNPNGFYIDGPVLEPQYKSFVGMLPIPIVHGMTLGELANMMNAEKWLKDSAHCDITIIPCFGYTHSVMYKLPIPPSPNLKTMDAIYLYPSLCLFEGTDVSVGRGTSKPFEYIGKPGFEDGRITFKPKSIKGVAENPPYKDLECKGFDVGSFAQNYIINSRKLYLLWLQGFYQKSDTAKFFNNFFDKLAGNDKLRNQIMNNVPIADIYKSW
ncbi:MAG: DUF1343 domain-containing protein, partial [Bacteroidetes bacterium]|nr:DUF1343 domain-containing protein [Bacteroidota bacterium]